MPEMDGVAFVREQMARRPMPIVIISVASPSGEQVLAALEAGAVDFLQKPTALATDRLLDVADELVAKVKAAAGAQMWRVAPAARRRRGTARVAASSARPRRHSADWHLDRRPAGAEVAGAAAAGRLPGAGGDGAAHAGRLHRAVREEARRDVARCA